MNVDDQSKRSTIESAYLCTKQSTQTKKGKSTRQIMFDDNYEQKSYEDFNIEQINKVSAYEINDELLEFYVDFMIKNEILFAPSLRQLKGNFNWARFQAFTQ